MARQTGRHFMKTLFAVVVAAGLLTTSGCICADGFGTSRCIDGKLVDAEGRPVSAWVGADEKEQDPSYVYGNFTAREDWGQPDTTTSRLVHTGEDGTFNLDQKCSDAGYGGMLLFGFIPVMWTLPPDVPILDHIFLYVHDSHGWHPIRVSLTPQQQTRHEYAERWVSLGTVSVH